MYQTLLDYTLKLNIGTNFGCLLSEIFLCNSNLIWNFKIGTVDCVNSDNTLDKIILDTDSSVNYLI